ncbi:hypothetical protein DAETH_29120 [Deinococcus aetherius]|uniref:Uncharacterized protein n=1 Tax=Deinococcus aetherius TaxID=200252 RepID=A0ABM8AGK7_9DEIO|nr:hypothetical protein [Deinococcus aetherius]BDP42943.1 hypothetical protein DAETH_29120 [Deinococcus aetherius]
MTAPDEVVLEGGEVRSEARFSGALGEAAALEGGLTPSGPPGVGVADVGIDPQGHLTFKLTDGREVDAGMLPGERGGTFSASLAESASVYSVVVALGGALRVADPSDPTHAGRVVGLLTQSGAAGERVQVAVIGALPGWGGPQGLLWVGADGQPRGSPSAGAWRQVVAHSPEPGQIVVQLRPSVLLAP